MRKQMNNPANLGKFFDFARLFGPQQKRKPTKGAFGQSKGQKKNRRAKG